MISDSRLPSSLGANTRLLFYKDGSSSGLVKSLASTVVGSFVFSKDTPGVVLKTVVIYLFYLLIGPDRAEDYKGVTPSITAVRSLLFS